MIHFTILNKLRQTDDFELANRIYQQKHVLFEKKNFDVLSIKLETVKPKPRGLCLTETGNKNHTLRNVSILTEGLTKTMQL